jgi:lantibiotic modifying enzyme
VPFWLEFAYAREDGVTRERALARARELARALQPDAASGLYTGLAGVAWARAIAGEEPLARSDFEALLARGQRDGERLAWSASLDVIDGAAGIGFALLFAHERLALDGALRAARGAGETLLAAAVEHEAGLRWPPAVGATRSYPNFSHGTAGIAAFLLELGSATSDERFLAAAQRGASYLAAVAQATGERGCAVHHSEPGNERLLYAGWCHGPAGTAPLFARLQALAPEPRWSEAEARFARGLHELGVPSAGPGFWNNVSRCCGHAGVLEFLLARHARLGKDEDLLLAARVLADLLQRATVDALGCRWAQAEHRVRPSDLRAQVGLMQGAAGIGLALLRCEGALQARAPRVRFPDEGSARPR